MAVTVVIGGPRSGKSRFALALAAAQGPRLGIIATRLPLGPEAEQECLRLRDERRDAFVTWEEPLRIVELVEAHLPQLDALVVDDATEWLGHLAAGGGKDPAPALDRLFALGARGPAHLVLVASETPAGRAEALAARSERVYQMADGLPVRVR